MQGLNNSVNMNSGVDKVPMLCRNVADGVKEVGVGRIDQLPIMTSWPRLLTYTN